MTWDADRAGESDEKKAFRVARTRAAVARLIFFCGAPENKTQYTDEDKGPGDKKVANIAVATKAGCFMVRLPGWPTSESLWRSLDNLLQHQTK